MNGKFSILFLLFGQLFFLCECIYDNNHHINGKPTKYDKKQRRRKTDLINFVVIVDVDDAVMLLGRLFGKIVVTFSLNNFYVYYLHKNKIINDSMSFKHV